VPSNERAEISAVPDLDPTKTTDLLSNNMPTTSKPGSIENEVRRTLTDCCGAAIAISCARKSVKSRVNTLNFKPIPEIDL
jgi:hypothetical protein